MTISEIGDRLVLTGSVDGNVFPKTEKETLFPLTIKPEDHPIQIDGSLYARSIDIGPGSVTIVGPVASRGDITVAAGTGLFRALAGITSLSGFVVGEKTQSKRQLVENLNECRTLVRGDIVCNQSILLNDAIVFGSINAVNCTLVNSVVLGTVHCSDQLSVEMSSIGGYLANNVIFRGVCALYNALGESCDKPQFLPYEDLDGKLVPSSVHLYPAVRSECGLRLTADQVTEDSLSYLYPDVDWISVEAEPDPLSESDKTSMRWVLSLGGRIADFSKINESSIALSEMLRVGFEYTHYNPETKSKEVEEVLKRLTRPEAAILEAVCY